jgi:hypothetical protein
MKRPCACRKDCRECVVNILPRKVGYESKR